LVFWPVLVVGQEGVSEDNYNTRDTSIARVLLGEADSLFKKRELDLAFEKVMKAKTIFTNVLGAETKEVAGCWDFLGSIFYFKKDIEKAETAWEMALIISEKVLEKNHLDIARLCNNLGAIARGSNNIDKAIDYFEGAIAVYLKNEGINQNGLVES